jgi:hypothetical protein
MQALQSDEDWVPPTEAELKVLAARRERSDKISKLMGDYMLKGYRMLATMCPLCDCVELQDRQGTKYCVACQEVDSQETSKDNPAVSERAASGVRAEEAFTTPRPPSPAPAPALPLGAAAFPSEGEGGAAPRVRQDRPGRQLQTSSQSWSSGAEAGASREERALLAHSQGVVRGKLAWATEQLRQCEDPEAAARLAALVRELAAALSALAGALRAT